MCIWRPFLVTLGISWPRLPCGLKGWARLQRHIWFSLLSGSTAACWSGTCMLIRSVVTSAGLGYLVDWRVEPGCRDISCCHCCLDLLLHADQVCHHIIWRRLPGGLKGWASLQRHILMSLLSGSTAACWSGTCMLIRSVDTSAGLGYLVDWRVEPGCRDTSGHHCCLDLPLHADQTFHWPLIPWDAFNCASALCRKVLAPCVSKWHSSLWLRLAASSLCHHHSCPGGVPLLNSFTSVQL